MEAPRRGAGIEIVSNPDRRTIRLKPLAEGLVLKCRVRAIDPPPAEEAPRRGAGIEIVLVMLLSTSTGKPLAEGLVLKFYIFSECYLYR